MKTWVLYTLNDHAKNGAEIMDSIEMMSYGSWRPSPGSIYPLLNKMVEENLIRKREDGRYELVPEGYDQANEFGENWASGSRSVGNILTDIDSYLAYLEDLPKEKVSPYEEKLGRIMERLGKLKDSLHK